VLASADIETILSGRREFGHKFTDEVEVQLTEWGVTNVKTIELMDIRDTDSSKVISNIMAKQKSVIEKDSRVAVAENMRAAQEAEVIAIREVELRKQEAQQQVGVRTEQAQQVVKDQAKITAEKDMAVRSVNAVRAAEIEKEAQIVSAEQNKATTILAAEAGLEQAKRHAEGVEVEGRAKGQAETAILMAPVNAQTALAKEIGQNAGYQTYLVGIRQIEASQVVGIEQAKALQVAEIKVIANSGNPVEGVTSVMDLLTPKGGAQLGAMLEAFKNTDAGKAVVDAATNGKGGI
jgi:flotillin